VNELPHRIIIYKRPLEEDFPTAGVDDRDPQNGRTRACSPLRLHGP